MDTVKYCLLFRTRRVYFYSRSTTEVGKDLKATQSNHQPIPAIGPHASTQPPARCLPLLFISNRLPPTNPARCSQWHQPRCARICAMPSPSRGWAHSASHDNPSPHFGLFPVLTVGDLHLVGRRSPLHPVAAVHGEGVRLAEEPAANRGRAA